MVTPYNLKDKTILVTGASSGIGKAISIHAAGLGARVFIIGRNEERLDQTYKLLEGASHEQFICDLTVEQQVNSMVSKLPALDGIVFCAGIVDILPGKFINEEKIRTIFNINYDSQLILYQKLHKYKKLNKNSSLVFISSISALLGASGTLLYASSKAAINATVRVLAKELSPQGIRVNSISPGIVKTAMTENASEIIDTGEFDHSEKHYPLGYGSPEDVAYSAAFLLADTGRWITGINLVIDGGFTLH